MARGGTVRIPSRLAGASLSEGAEANSALGVRVGGFAPVWASWGVEAMGSWSAAEVELVSLDASPNDADWRTAAGELRNSRLEVFAVHHGEASPRICPFWGLGLGKSRYSYRGSVSTSWLGAVKFGFEIPFSLKDGLRVDFQFDLTANQSRPPLVAEVLPSLTIFAGYRRRF